MPTATRPFTYVGCCIELDGDDINAMSDTRTNISNDRFRRLIGTEAYRWLSRELGYVPGEKLTLRSDWHVSYHRSTYQGKPCLFLVWSAIEYVFTQE